jgi:outer membrane protein TolC
MMARRCRPGAFEAMIKNPKNPALFLFFATAVLSVLLEGTAAAQKMFSPKLDLESAVSKAIESDPEIRSSQTLSKISKERIREARTGWGPTVQISQSFTRSNNPAFVFSSLLEQGRFTGANFSSNSLNQPDPLNNFRTSVSVRMPVFDQWQARSRSNRSTIEQHRAELQVEAVSQKVRFNVIKTYCGAILADELLKATDAAVRSAKENSRKTQDFVEVGMVAESDSLVASVELADVEQQKLEAQGAVVTTRAALNIAIGEKPEMLYELVGELQEKYFPEKAVSELVRIALEQRPDYQQARLAVDDSHEQTRSIRNRKLPSLDAFANLGYSSPDILKGSSDYTAGLALSYTVFDPGRKSRIEQSVLSEGVAASEKDRLKNQITLEVITADQNYQTARGKIRVSIRSVIQAEEALRILQDRYRSAISTFDAVLRAESALLRAKHELLKAKYEYYVSYAAILLATGGLTDASVFDH